ncbi:MAG: hypothetical protein ACXU99_13820 [Thermodesulfobacteriota bacterium]
MKKRISLVGIGLLVVSVALSSCAPVQKTMITNSNLSILKGTWQGWTTFSSAQATPVLTTMEINNDTVPLMGKMVLSNLPQPIANIFPGAALPAGNNVTIDFANGEISREGTLINHGGKNFIELTLYAGEKPKLNGWFYYYGVKGTMDLTKK